ncbi:MAG: hypothetical protein VX910_00195 [Candidatus Latescibacterota bacterium]|nr:hypothetical protein [Candidatus Latescibacterota bacterium]
MLSETWTEDKARKFLSDGFLSSLSPDILDSESKDLREAPKLEQSLRTIRRVLAEECMVEDDATDVMLLDIVVKALSDWILVYRIKAKDGALDEVERLMDIRSKADRRLMDAIAALKNS